MLLIQRIQGGLREKPLGRAGFADFMRRIHRLFNIARFKELRALLIMMRPNACKAVRLQLLAHGQLIALNLGRLRARLLHLR